MFLLVYTQASLYGVCFLIYVQLGNVIGHKNLIKIISISFAVLSEVAIRKVKPYFI